MKITIIGAGYVGLVVSVCFANNGHKVICLEKNAERCRMLSDGNCPILEKDLPTMLQKAIKSNSISFTTRAAKAIPEAEVIFIAVGTPSDKIGNADLSALYTAISDIKKHADVCRAVVIKSSVPPGTTDKVHNALLSTSGSSKFANNLQVVCNPEFLREGTAVNDFLMPDRLIIGTKNPEIAKLILSIYRPVLRNNPAEIITSPINAELIKYASNSYLAVRLSYINELAALCEAIGGNINEVALGMGLDHRIGLEYLNAGLGYGGACLPKDTKALSHIAQDADTPITVLESAIVANENVTSRIANRIANHLSPGCTVAILGVSFKAQTDDIRNSPVIFLMEKVFSILKCKFQIYDPSFAEFSNNYPDKLLQYMCDNSKEAIETADALIIGAGWQEFKNESIYSVLPYMRGHIIFDFARVLDKTKVNTLGFDYFICGEK